MRSKILAVLLVISLMSGCSWIQSRVNSGQWVDDTRLGLHAAYLVVSVLCIAETMNPEQCAAAGAAYNKTLQNLALFEQDPDPDLRDQILESIKEIEALPAQAWEDQDISE